MRSFTKAYTAIEKAPSDEEKEASFINYLREASIDELPLALHLLLGRKMKRLCSAAEMKRWASDASQLPQWLIDECGEATGDVPEAVAMLLGDTPTKDESLIACIRGVTIASNRGAEIRSLWSYLSTDERYIFNRILTGGLRKVASTRVLARALAAHLGITLLDASLILSRVWDPMRSSWEEVIEAPSLAMPHIPFCLAHEEGTDLPQQPEEWTVEWHWNGDRVQIVKGAKQSIIWSEREEVVTSGYPDLSPLLAALPPSTILDGMIVTREGLQRFVAVDLLVYGGDKVTEIPFQQRRELLVSVTAETPSLEISPLLDRKNLEELEELRRSARDVGAEGLFLKRRNSPYREGRTSDWLKVRSDPFSIRAVLMYVQRAERRAPQIYTFGVWKDEELISVVKCSIGLSEGERNAISAFIKSHSRERFGPVRTVEPKLVVEIGFRGVERSSRHKAGVIPISPQMLRLRQELEAADADGLVELQRLLRDG